MLKVEVIYRAGQFVARDVFAAPDDYTKLDISLGVCEWAQRHNYRVPEGQLTFITFRNGKSIRALSSTPKLVLY